MSARFAALASSYVGRRVRLLDPVRGETVGCIIRVTAAGFQIRTFGTQELVTRCNDDVREYLT